MEIAKQQPEPDFSTIDYDGILQDLDEALSECKAEIAAAFEDAQPQLKRFQSSIEGFRRDLSLINEDAKKLRLAISSSQENVARLGAVQCDIQKTEAHLAEIAAGQSFLERILTSWKCFEDFDQAVDRSYFDVAADSLAKVSDMVLTLMSDMRSDMTSKKDAASRTTSPARHDDGRKLFAGEDVNLVLHLEEELIERKQRLHHQLTQLVDAIFCISPSSLEVITDPAADLRGKSLSCCTLEHLWHALKSTGYLKEELTALATSLAATLLDAIAKAAESLGSGRTILVKARGPEGSLGEKLESGHLMATNARARSCAVWTWMESPAPKQPGRGPNSAEAASPQDVAVSGAYAMKQDTASGLYQGIVILIDVIERLFEFIAAYFFPGHSDVLEVFGGMLYAPLAERLVAQLQAASLPETQGRKGNEAADDISGLLASLREFEAKVRTLHVIPPSMTTLTSFCDEYSTILFAARSTKLLDEARRLGLSCDPAVVTVGDSSTNDVMLAALAAGIRDAKAFAAKRSQGSHGSAALAVAAEILRRLDASPLVMPKCSISRVAFDLMHLADSFMCELLTGPTQNANDGSFDVAVSTLQDMISIFLMLRASLHKDRFADDLLLSSIFFSDCLYLSRRLLLLLVTPTLVGDGSSSFSPDKMAAASWVLSPSHSKQARLSFVHIAAAARTLQEKVITTMLAEKQERLIKMCATVLSDFSDIALDRQYTVVEGALSGVLRTIKESALVWASVLPHDAAEVCIEVTVDTFLKKFLDQICVQVLRSHAVKSKEPREADTWLPPSGRSQANSGSERVAPLSPQDARALTFLLASVRDQVSIIIMILSSETGKSREGETSAGTIPAPSDETWVNTGDELQAFELFCDIVNADLPEILERRDQIREKLTTDQLRTALLLNHTKTWSADAILDLLSNAEEPL